MSTPTPKQIAAGQVRTLRAMRKKLLSMTGPWEGVDEYCRTRIGETADAIEQLAVDLTQDEEQL